MSGMSEKVLVASISGSAAFLGALIAFVGLWITTRRTQYIAREQRRFDLVRDKRGVVLPKMCTRLWDLLQEIRAWVSLPIELQDAEGNFSQQVIAESLAVRNNKRKQLIEEITELAERHKKDSIWLPQD